MTEVKVKRSQVQSFILTDTGPDVWSLIGKGVTTGTINYNPETSSETYISEDGATVDVERYAPTLPLEAIAIKGNAVFDFIDNLRKTRATLDAARTYLMNVWLYETPTSTDNYPAEKQEVSIQIDSFGRITIPLKSRKFPSRSIHSAVMAALPHGLTTPSTLLVILLLANMMYLPVRSHPTRNNNSPLSNGRA